jgi:superfamily II DNA or RNA helicase
MPIKAGDIVNNIAMNEPVVVNSIKTMGSWVNINYTGKTSNIAGNKSLPQSDFDNLTAITSDNTFNFSGDPSKFTLFAEAERINSAYQFDPMFAVNCSIVDPLPHQVEAVYKYLLPLPKIRFLLADDTGAGKTIMTGLLVKELIMRGMIERVLIITPGGLTKQWQLDEMGIKFNMNFRLVNRSEFQADPNVFQSSDKIVTSIDFISRADVLNVVSNSHWDLVVIDESHKLSAYEYGNRVYLSKRYNAAYVLSQRCEHLLLLTATPHRGRADTFKKLLQLLDEDIFSTDDIASTRVKELEQNGANKFFIRRLKEDMKDWQGNPLFKKRFTKTVSYELTPDEKRLYDEVTKYLSKKKEEAFTANNIHVSLALTVMQRRLVSSIFAIKNTLYKRWHSLDAIVAELAKNPGLWNQRYKVMSADIDDLDADNIQDYVEEFEDLEDDQREALEGILADPKKFKLFTTANSPQELKDEAKEVKRLYDMAETLYNNHQEEQKFKELQKLLISKNVINGEKLVIFTEHKDTLKYLEERLSRSGGYRVATIHGSKNVDERIEAQRMFKKADCQILIATDAAGEGINLQFCPLLINWDIPWNPNRLEQRMGRIHRYGQERDVLVFNMVASNTKEGAVLERLLTKMDAIRESIGDDRVYDVIQDVLAGVSMEEVYRTVLNGERTKLNDIIDQDFEVSKEDWIQKIKQEKEKLGFSQVDYSEARALKEQSDEKRLQPIYVKLFFEKALKQLGGDFVEIRSNIFDITVLPESVVKVLKADFNIYADVKNVKFCFDKQVFLNYQSLGDIGTVHYINPGNPLFDSVIKVVRTQFKEEMLKGTILISPDENEDYFAYFVRSQIKDNRQNKKADSIADERLMLVCQDRSGSYSVTSPAKYLDLKAPADFAKPIDTPAELNTDEVVAWSFDQITVPQFEDTQNHVTNDAQKRREYLESGFSQVIFDLTLKRQEYESKILIGDNKVQDKIININERIDKLTAKKIKRMEDLDLMLQLSPKMPEVLGCAYVVPLSQVEYQSHYGMSRDDEAEAIAMQIAMDYEISQGWNPIDVSKNNEGYDVKSVSPEQLKKYIEVKGRNIEGGVMLSENEMNRLGQLGDSAWLYIIVNCKSNPTLHRIQNPANILRFEKKSKGVQYYLPHEEWIKKLTN